MLLEFFHSLPSQFPYAIQLLLASVIFTIYIKKRSYFAVRAIVGIIAFLVVGYFVPDIQVAGFLFIPFIVLIPIILLAMWFLFDSDAKTLLFSLTCIVLLQHIAECATWLLRELFGILNTDVMWSLMSVFCYVAMYTAAYFLFVRKKKTTDFINIKPWKLIVASIAAFIIIYFLRESLMFQIKEQHIEFILVNIAINLYSAICCLFAFATLFSFKQTDSLTIEKQKMSELLSKEQVNYSIIMANMNSINYKCHDLKHQITFLRKAENKEEREKYIEKLEKEIMIYEHTPKTGNSALDATLANKSLFCEENKIEFTYIADAKELNFMEPTDIFSLVGNAVDNAIECVMKYEDTEKRLISMRISSIGKLVKIYIENYCEERLEIKGGGINSTKQDKDNHGFGIKSMRYIAAKYGGHVNIEQKGNLFVLNILLPIDRI